MVVYSREMIEGDVRRCHACSPVEARLLSALSSMPFLSIPDMVSNFGFSRSRLNRTVLRLEATGFIRRFQLGATVGRVSRFALTPYACGVLWECDTSWNSDGNLGLLLPRMAAVEMAYEACAGQSGLGPLEGFSWFRGAVWDAAARFQRGWAVLIWSGACHSEEHVRGLFHRLGPDLERLSVGFGGSFPDLLIFMVSDPWQRALVDRVADDLRLGGIVQTWCASDHSSAGEFEAYAGYGSVSPVASRGGLGDWSLEGRLSAAVASANGGGLRFGLLQAAFEWPGFDVRFARAILSVASGGKWVYSVVTDLVDGGYLAAVRTSGQRFAYYMTNHGYYALVSRDRLQSAPLPDRLKPPATAVPRLDARHEAGVRLCVSLASTAGMAVACGFRSWEHLGGVGGIEPDALINVGVSPYGAGWHYLEYELRASGERRVEAKLRGYASFLRRDRWPVMMVCSNDRVEALFHQIGHVAGVKLLTTTVSRLNEMGFLSCWSLFGRPVLIA